MSNPLLNDYDLPPFDKIKSDHIVPAIEKILQDNLNQIDQIVQSKPSSWGALIKPLEELDDRLHKAWSPVRHMNSVVSETELRKSYNQCLPLITDYSTKVSQNQGLYEAFLSLSQHKDFDKQETSQKKVVTNALRDFKLQGIALSVQKQQQFKTIKKRLSGLESRFQDNVLDATDHWHLDIKDKAQLKGVPEADLQLFSKKAQDNQVEGYRLTLEFPCYYAIVTYAENQKLRETLYEAYITRASDQGSLKGQYDNTEIMREILKCRHELAQLLDYPTYAHYSLEKKMARSTQEVLVFLRELAGKAKPFAANDFKKLTEFAKQKDGVESLMPWDVSFYAEQLKQDQYAVSDEVLRPYFPIEKVLAGLYTVVQKTFGIQIREIQEVKVWHPSVRFFEVYDKKDELRGKFYLDLFARSKKRQGAWMDDAIGRRKKEDDTIQIPVAYVTCNFRPGVGEIPALLSHDEMVTLFHEFGHALHHMLTQMEHLDISGISGVPWDAVELPSQFLENWCWQKEALPLISGHYQTGALLPESLFDKLLSSKNFMAGMHIVRQLEFAIFDFRCHLEFDEQQKNQIQRIIDEVRAQVSVVPAVPYNRFQHSFNHIFSGGYAAGYYSYLWAEVLASDAFARFKEEGLFNPKVGEAFMTHILEKGGSEEPDVLFRLFRGRAHKLDYLLEDYGLLE